MNRLILIGNGFDLAHGMKTSYYDFICDYIRKVCQIANTEIEYENELMYVKKEITYYHEKIDDNRNIKALFYLQKPMLPGHIDFVNQIYRESTNGLGVRKPFVINFKNNFIEKIFTQCHESKWVDIENEFYEELKKILKLNDSQKHREINKLNSVFKSLISELNTYMHLQHTNRYEEKYLKIFEGDILKNDLSIPIIDKDEPPENLLLLNFNYTNILSRYLKTPRFVANYIHGQTNNENNPIIFGFGDEIDLDYKKIEDEKEKGFLDYMKSFGYFKTSNYHDLIRFISSNMYQVYLLGHSCGLSDRTMLNMIFEHDNCRSIKIFYYGTKDNNNYTALTQEISRHFTNKGKMRERIVSLDKSFPMPQFNE